MPLLDVRALSTRIQTGAGAVTVVDDVSFTLERGQTLALVGESGSGKSTLLEALAGWLPLQAGSLQTAAGAQLAYASQRPYLFHGSIADNLRMARPQASEAQLYAAAEAAQVLRFADQLPQDLDTPVGERGFGLSGGEARRVGLARALLAGADVLLLDEPTAFLDPQTEAALLHSLQQLRTQAAAQGRPLTIVMATHSEAAMAAADRVLSVQAWRPAAGSMQDSPPVFSDQTLDTAQSKGAVPDGLAVGADNTRTQPAREQTRGEMHGAVHGETHADVHGEMRAKPTLELSPS